MMGEVRIILMNYWITYSVLKARSPKYQKSSSIAEDSSSIVEEIDES